MTNPSNRRKYPTLSQSFQARARLLHRSAELSGITHNLSQSGAFIISPSWSDFQVDDETEIMFFSLLSLQGRTILRFSRVGGWGNHTAERMVGQYVLGMLNLPAFLPKVLFFAISASMNGIRLVS